MKKKEDAFDLPDYDYRNHMGDSDFLTKPFYKMLNAYNEKFANGIPINYIKEEITAKQAIERMEKAIKDNKPIKESDKTFFEQD